MDCKDGKVGSSAILNKPVWACRLDVSMRSQQENENGFPNLSYSQAVMRQACLSLPNPIYKVDLRVSCLAQPGRYS